MPRSPKFSPRLTPDGWAVEIPESMSSSGRRERRFFAIERDAIRFAAVIRSQWREGRRGGIIPADLARMAAEAERMLKPHGLTILDAARAAVARIEADGDRETLRERYDAAVIDGEGRWSERYLSDMERLPKWVGPELMARRVADLSPAMIDAALREHGAEAQSTLEMRRRYVAAILGHRPAHRKSRTVEILTLKQAEALLAACGDLDERRAVALLLWAGIRPDATHGEISRLDWGAVGATEIYIGRREAKTNTDRIIPVTARLAREIAGHPAEGTVAPANWKRRWARIRKDAGVSGQDITRHTFASYFLAAFGEDAALAAMGHTAGSRTLFRHYRAAVAPEQGREYFG